MAEEPKRSENEATRSLICQPVGHLHQDKFLVLKSWVWTVRGVPSVWLAMPSRHCEQSMYRCIHFQKCHSCQFKSTWHSQLMVSNTTSVIYYKTPAIRFIGSSATKYLPPNVWYCKLLGTQKNQWDPFTMIRSWFLSPACGNSSRSSQCVTGRAKSRSQANEVPLYLFYRNVIQASTSRSGTANEWFAGKTFFLDRKK